MSDVPRSRVPVAVPRIEGNAGTIRVGDGPPVPVLRWEAVTLTGPRPGRWYYRNGRLVYSPPRPLETDPC